MGQLFNFVQILFCLREWFFCKKEKNLDRSHFQQSDKARKKQRGKGAKEREREIVKERDRES